MAWEQIALLCLVLSAGCGRLRFDTVAADAGDASADAPVPVAPWMHHLSGAGFDVARALAAGDDGALYVTGAVDGTIDFGMGGFAATADLFLAIYEPDGTLRAARVFPCSAYTQGNGIAVDHDGTAFVVAMGQGTFSAGGTSHVSAGGVDLVVASYMADSTPRWSKFFGASGDDIPRAVAVDAQGNIYVTGVFHATVDFSEGTAAALTSVGGADVFVASWTHDGLFRWSIRYGTAGDDDALAIAAATDRVWVAGSFRNTLDIGTPPPTAVSQDAYVASFDFSGTSLAAYGYGSSGFDIGDGLAVLSSDDVVVVGTAGGDIDFGGGSRLAGTQLSTFIARIGPDRTHRWSSIFPATGTNQPGWVVVDSHDDVHVAGFTIAPLDLGAGAMPYVGGEDIYVAHFAGDGALVSGRTFGGAADDEGLGIAVNRAGNVAVAGSYNAAIDFGTAGAAANGGMADAFLIQLPP